jgi:hypothetical protein
VSDIQAKRLALALRRIKSVLRTNIVCHLRTLEQKICDAGPINQRIDPHVVTNALRLLKNDLFVEQSPSGGRWFRLRDAPQAEAVAKGERLEALLAQIHSHTFTLRIGQALETAVFRGLLRQSTLNFYGGFPDLDSHDDSTLYKNVPPPAIRNGRSIGNRLFDFIVSAHGVDAGIEVKNIREWVYPTSTVVKELVFKALTLDLNSCPDSEAHPLYDFSRAESSRSYRPPDVSPAPPRNCGRNRAERQAQGLTGIF